MSLTDDATSDARYFEGLRLTIYDDATGDRISTGYLVKGHPTIGYGIALDTGGITKAEAEYLLANRIASFTAWAQANLAPVWGTLCDPRQRVIVGMLFEIGVAGYRGFKEFNRALANGDYVEASNQIVSSVAFTQSPKRWQWYADVMKSGEIIPYE